MACEHQPVAISSQLCATCGRCIKCCPCTECRCGLCHYRRNEDKIKEVIAQQDALVTSEEEAKKLREIADKECEEHNARIKNASLNEEAVSSNGGG